ncbi:MAG: two-component sensor histidine kinase, partial [Acidimicrobiia bacterium]|nr:two-component sensor histidine kinase [Acidimicrobiia bacterium]
DDVVAAARHRTPRTISLDPGKPATIVGRPKALSRAISNLVDNAIKHGAGAIEIEIDGGSISVRDHGPGIPEADLPRIFDLDRAGVARTEAGSGLGLAIVAQVVEHHGGAVFAHNHPDGGAVIGFSLPTETT